MERSVIQDHEHKLTLKLRKLEAQTKRLDKSVKSQSIVQRTYKTCLRHSHLSFVTAMHSREIIYK